MQNKAKRLKLFTFLKDKLLNNGVFFLQETHSTHSDEVQWQNEWGGKLFFSHGSNDSKGVCIGFTGNLDPKLEKISYDNNGRIIIIDLILDDEKYIFVNLYNANTESEQLYTINCLNNLLSNHNLDGDYKPIFTGDLNFIFDANLDALGGNRTLKTKSLAAIIKLLDNLDVCDIFRIRYPNKKRFTFRQKTRAKEVIHRRLDYIFLSNCLQENAKNIDILPSFLSDHSPVLLTLDASKNNKRGRGLWKFNNSLLQEESFRDGISNTVCATLADNTDSNPHVLWELLKYDVRKFSIKFSKDRSKLKKIDKQYHENIVQSFESNPNVSILQEEYNNSKIWLESWYTETTKGAILRSKAEWYENGEKSSKFFLNLEKNNSIKNTIRKLYVNNDNSDALMLSDNEDTILKHSEAFYKNLFTRKSKQTFEECSTFLGGINTPSLSIEQKELCDAPIKIEELTDSLNSMYNGKTPGNDGLTIEFYKSFWDLLKYTLFNSFLYSKIHGSLSISQRQAIIKLLEKKERDKRYIENWRPISLLNVDTKIISKSLANRLKIVLPDIISHDQSAYVKGRFIGESTRLISDILEVSDQFNVGGYLLTADIEKAFDSMDHQFLIAALTKFGFGDNFIHWINILLNKNESCIINGGTTSKYFELQRGARQGDPIAAYLFIIALEIYFIMVRADDQINKLNICDYEFLLSAYADDTTFFVQDLDSIRRIFNLFDTFSTFSGFKLNFSKCELCGIGVLKGVETALCNVKNVNLTNNSIKVLGVYYSYDKNICEEKNFISTIKKIENVLKVWKMRNLTLYGKIVIFKSLAISKIIYISHMSSVPSTIINHLVKTHNDFIWDGKKPKIKHSTLIGNYEDGGLRDIDICSKIKALQLSWLKRLHDNNFHPWKIIPTYLFSKMSVFGKDMFFPNLKLDTSGFFYKLPMFYQNILTFWMEFSCATPITASSILSECIWTNNFIQIGNKVISPSFLSCQKRIYVSDLFDLEGNILKWDDFFSKHNLPQNLFFRWVQVVDAVPQNWIKIIKEDAGKSRLFCEFIPHAIMKAKLYPLSKLNSQEIYRNLIASKIKPPTSHAHFFRIFHTDSLPWKKIYTLARTITIDSYSRIFQYKCLNNILYLNLPLFRMGISDTPLCSYCQLHNETLQHLFFDCKVSSALWSELKIVFRDKLTLPSLDHQSAVFGFLGTADKDNLIFNNILLMFKISLYKNRDNKKITLHNVLCNLKSREIIERSLVSLNQRKLDFHNNKWDKIIHCLNS